MRTAPEVTSYSRGSSEIVVDLPAPEAPTSATVSPGATVNERPVSTSTSGSASAPSPTLVSIDAIADSAAGG